MRLSAFLSPGSWVPPLVKLMNHFGLGHYLMGHGDIAACLALHSEGSLLEVFIPLPFPRLLWVCSRSISLK